MRHACVDFGSACKWPSYSARWVAMDIMRFYVIQTGLFSETFRIFGIEWSHWTISHPWVIVLGCKVSLISPLPRCVCGGGGGGANSYSMILPIVQSIYLKIWPNLKQIPSEKVFRFSWSIRSIDYQKKSPQKNSQAKCIFLWAKKGAFQANMWKMIFLRLFQFSSNIILH